MSRPRPHTILIVDDNSNLRKLVRLTLESITWALHEAQDGAGAIEQVQELEPDIVLLDVMMPGGIDGYQTCEAIKTQRGNATRVIMLTARGQERDRSQARAAGADGYLLKPFSPLELIETVEKWADVAPNDAAHEELAPLPA